MEILIDIIDIVFLVFGITIVSSYISLAILAAFEIRKYQKANEGIDHGLLMNSDFAPTIGIIAPAYNESATIVENTKSLLSINYPKLKVILVNDGSKDDSLEKIIKAYHLKKVSYSFEQSIKTQEIRGVYKSAKAAYSNLIVVDKVNGGKADSLNVGINIAETDLIACIDVDCMIAEDALLKTAKPFMEAVDTPLIALGAPVKVANSCTVHKGKLIEARTPGKWLPNFQILEYTRAFLLGRMGWSRINGLIIVSGAFGVFDRKIALLAGGYDHRTVGEDMELIVRMRRYMREQKLPHKVAMIPEPLCWTEVPDSLKILGNQRNRWTRGTIETLTYHKKLLFNRKYGILGMVSYPFWMLFEWFAPLVEAFGIIFFLVFFAFTSSSFTFFLWLLFAVYLFAISYSTFALIIENHFVEKYERVKDTFKLAMTALLEPFLYHPINVWFSIKGNWSKITRQKLKWGQMERKGFNASAK